MRSRPLFLFCPLPFFLPAVPFSPEKSGWRFGEERGRGIKTVPVLLLASIPTTNGMKVRDKNESHFCFVLTRVAEARRTKCAPSPVFHPNHRRGETQRSPQCPNVTISSVIRARSVYPCAPYEALPAPCRIV